MSSIAHLPQFEELKDDHGSVILAWAGGSVLHAKLSGALSEQVGCALVAHIAQAVRGGRTISYFGDASTLSSYDVVARSAFVRVVLSHRRQFKSFVMLTRVDMTATAQAFAAAIGEPVTILADPVQFDQLLTAAAPLARQRLDGRKPQQGARGGRPRPR